MQSLRGVVIGGGRMLEVRLASGRIVSVPHTKGVRRWDKVEVLWDYSRGKAVRVRKFNALSELNENPDQPAEPEDLGEEQPVQEDEPLETGALCPLGVESGESGFWDLVLSDGSLGAAGVM